MKNKCTNHIWVQSQGFTSIYTDCSICGMKYEDYLKEQQERSKIVVRSDPLTIPNLNQMFKKVYAEDIKIPDRIKLDNSGKIEPRKGWSYYKQNKDFKSFAASTANEAMQNHINRICENWRKQLEEPKIIVSNYLYDSLISDYIQKTQDEIHDHQIDALRYAGFTVVKNNYLDIDSDESSSGEE